MPDRTERFWYPFTATTVIVRKLAPLLLFTLGTGLFLWAGREYYFWTRPWSVWAATALGFLAWFASALLFSLLPEVRIGENGLCVRRWGLFWRCLPWARVAGVRATGTIDLLGWVESLYTVYVWSSFPVRPGRLGRGWHRREVRAFRFSGHVRNSEQLLASIEEHTADETAAPLPADRADSTSSEPEPSVPARVRPHGRRLHDSGLVRWEGRLLKWPGRPVWFGAAFFAALLAVYWRTLAPGVLGGDVGELQFVPYILGMAHPTGTPLYCLLGKLWTLLPIGPSVAWRMNLLSAVSAVLAICLVYALVWGLTRRILPALVAALSLGLGATFWEQATMADKYAFNALLVALVLAMALRWGKTRSPTTLNLLALSYGLSLTHHRTNVLLAPLLLGYVVWYERSALWRNRRRLLRLVLLLLAPLLIYLYLPWAEARNLPPGTWHPHKLQEWVRQILDIGSVGYVYVDAADLGQRLLFFARTLQQDFTWPGVAIGLIGLAWQLRWRRAEGMLLLLLFCVEGFLAANHHLPRQWTFFIPSFLVFAVWIGEGLGAIWQGLERVWRDKRWYNVGLGTPVALGMLALPLVAAPLRYQSFRATHDGAGLLDPWRQAIKQGEMGERLGRAIAGVQADAIIVGDWEQATPLWYFQQVARWRPDVQIVYPIERLDEAAATGRPLYLARTSSGLADRWHPSSSGPLIALRSEPTFDLPADVSPLSIQLGETFELAGFAYGKARFQPASVVPLTLYWRAIQVPAYDYAVSLRLLDAAGNVCYQADIASPVLGSYPTSRWSAGEVVADYYEIQLAPDLPPGTYRWGVILYRTLPEGGWENLQVAGIGAEMAIGGSFQVQ
jgi:hypothetical protein